MNHQIQQLRMSAKKLLASKNAAQMGLEADFYQVLMELENNITSLSEQLLKTSEAIELKEEVNRWQQIVEGLLDTVEELIAIPFAKLELKRVYEWLDADIAELDDLIEEINEKGGQLSYIEAWEIDFFFN